MFHLADSGIGNQLPRQRKFVIGQGGDETLARFNCLFTCEQEREAVARARKGDAGPGFLAVGDDLCAVLGKG
ncbi:MAG: hypothetical protein H2048_06715 [Erythrobacter sp.]|nr:hypothetical protein [Erythrobacter sp.]